MPMQTPEGPYSDTPLNHACETFNQVVELVDAVRKLADQLCGSMPPTPTMATDAKAPGPSNGLFGLVGEKSAEARREIAYAYAQLNRISERL